MGDPVVKTPAFDRVAREGILFTHAFCDAPSCGPSRSAILTGQHIWQLEQAGNIHSRLPDQFATYVGLLEQAGYAVGSYSKAWSPGQSRTPSGWIHNSQTTMNPAGKRFGSFQEFHGQKPEDRPFCFWLGSNDAHRAYKRDSGLQSGMDPAKVVVPDHLPDDPIVRRDILDYYFEVQRFDSLVGETLAFLEEAGELDNTLVVVTSDNGMPFPRAKATLYDFGTRMPLAIRWPKRTRSPGRVYDGFIHLSDMAPTFLEAAGLQPPDAMTARSLMDVFAADNMAARDAAFTAMERHDGCRKGGKGYPCRAIRTRDFLYIRNYEPDRWPAGDPDASHCARAIPFGEVDSSPTKSLLMDRADDPEFRQFYELAFGHRPAEELYDLRSDPGQVTNVASLPDYADAKRDLSDRLQQYTARTDDPRALGKDAPWDYYPYYGRQITQDWKVDSRPSSKDATGPVKRVWRPVPSSLGSGLLAERVDSWRGWRMWHMLDAEDEYMLSGFENHPGRHPWQGEHLGKWLHAAVLAYEQTRDANLAEAMQTAVNRLLATQEPNGYMGTYGPATRFTAMPENVSLAKIADDIEPTGRGRRMSGWDTWTFRYNLYGLLTYERFHPSDRVVAACERMADLLIEVYGEGKADLTKYGTRQGISATTLLESIVMLYERTEKKKYLDFAEHIVAMSENNPKLRLMGGMQEHGSVVNSGDGKAYQLMANLLGYLGLYRNTGDERYLKTIEEAWEDIKVYHLDITGGPWGRHMSYNGNRECFAFLQDYDPAEADVETCSTTTWVQLNLHLLEMTGQARYAAEAERAVLNALIAAQHENGQDWCYYIRANQTRRPYEVAIKCCSSSGPRALEMFTRYLVGEVEGGVSLTSLVPCSADLPASTGGARLTVMGDYPADPTMKIRFDKAHGQEFALEFRDPANSTLKSLRVNGEAITPNKNRRGYYRVAKAWKTGDEIALEYEYLLASHVVAPVDDPVWVAFAYGPWALAQTTDESDAVAEPFFGKDVRSAAPSHWLDQLEPTENGAPRFRVKDSEILLGPFFSAGSKETGPRTYFRIAPSERPAGTMTRRIPARPTVDISNAVAVFAPGWSVNNCGDFMSPGLLESFRGKSRVLLTHPADPDTPCTLSKTVDIPAGRRTVLTVVVSHHQRGDWQLALKVDGQQRHATRTISAKSCPADGWLAVEFDLSDSAGQTVELELLNRATDWRYEGGFWREVTINSETTAAQAN